MIVTLALPAIVRASPIGCEASITYSNADLDVWVGVYNPNDQYVESDWGHGWGYAEAYAEAEPTSSGWWSCRAEYYIDGVHAGDSVDWIWVD
jgi:hypothetical protein